MNVTYLSFCNEEAIYDLMDMSPCPVILTTPGL